MTSDDRALVIGPYVAGKSQRTVASTDNVVPILWHRPRWLRVRVITGVWVLLLAYGSLMPFDFRMQADSESAGGVGLWLINTLYSPRWVNSQQTIFQQTSSLGNPNWINDLALNILLYLPLGVLVGLAGAKHGRSRVNQIIRRLIGIMALSWLLECAQSLMPARCGSLNDFLANSLSGIVGVVVAVRVRHAAYTMVFWMYRKISCPFFAVTVFWERQRHRPVMMLVVVTINIVLITVWAVVMAPSIGRHADGSVNWLPFMDHFERSYDVASMYVGQSLVVYGLIAILLSLHFLRTGRRWGLSWMVLLVAATAGSVEVIRAATGTARADVSGPVIALTAIGLIMTTAFLLVHAVRCSCRRRRQIPIPLERRYRRHDYRFASGACGSS